MRLRVQLPRRELPTNIIGPADDARLSDISFRLIRPCRCSSLPSAAIHEEVLPLRAPARTQMMRSRNHRIASLGERSGVAPDIA